MRPVLGRSLRRGVLVVPSLFTLGNLFCGFYALMEASKGRWLDLAQGEGATHLERAAVFIALAMVLDGLDGRIARLAHATSPIGIQLDSLSDVVSFGVAPAVLVYSWALVELPRPQLAWAVAFVFTSCGALRLARFNVQAQDAPDTKHFVGLPIPGAAGGIAALVFARPEPVKDLGAVAAVAVLTVVLSLLMVSTIRYPSLKQIDLRRRLPLRNLLWVVGFLAAFSAYPAVALLSLVFLFIASGPAGHLLRRLRGAAPPEPEAKPEARPPHPPGGPGAT